MNSLSGAPGGGIEFEEQFEGAEHDTRLMEEFVARGITKALDAFGEPVPGDRLLEARQPRARADARALGKAEVPPHALAAELDFVRAGVLLGVDIARGKAQVQERPLGHGHALEDFVPVVRRVESPWVGARTRIASSMKGRTWEGSARSWA